jgi:hypothetical protein
MTAEFSKRAKKYLINQNSKPIKYLVTDLEIHDEYVRGRLGNSFMMISDYARFYLDDVEHYFEI